MNDLRRLEMARHLPFTGVGVYQRRDREGFLQDNIGLVIACNRCAAVEPHGERWVWVRDTAPGSVCEECGAVQP